MPICAEIAYEMVVNGAEDPYCFVVFGCYPVAILAVSKEGLYLSLWYYRQTTGALLVCGEAVKAGVAKCPEVALMVGHDECEVAETQL